MIQFIGLLLCAVLLPFNAVAQNDSEEIRASIEEYFSHVEAFDGEKISEFIYPKFFELAPKESIVQAMDKMKNDTAAVVSFSDSRITKISKTILLDEVKYALVNYSFTMKTKFQFKRSTEDEFFDQMAFTLSMFRELYGKKNVRLDETDDSFIITKNNAMYAIKAPEYEGWKFLEKKKGKGKMLNAILPKKIIRRL